MRRSSSDIMDLGLLYAVIGGLFEPVWVWFLASSGKQEGRRKIIFLALFLITSVVSVYWVGLAMRSMNIGAAYAVWTAVGAVTTLVISRFAFGEEMNLLKILAAIMIIQGIVGIHTFGGVA